MTKHVLCLARTDIPDSWLGTQTAIPMEEDSFFQCLGRAPMHWVPREQAECASDFKQLIPYILIQNCDGSAFGVYRRAGNESRLHDYWSIGVGGHVEPLEGNVRSLPLPEVVNLNMHRELAEEIVSMTGSTGPEFRGVINEEQTGVGTVHLGLVHVVTVDDPQSLQPGEELVDFHWLPRPAVEELHLELWSRMALELVG